MPCIYSHLYMGCSVREAIGGSAGALLYAHEPAFYAGLIGPDPYFFDALLPPIRRRCLTKTAYLLHRLSGEELLAAFLPLARQDADRMAYALGFLCHFLLDAGVHPYVLAHYPGREHTHYEASVEEPFLRSCGSPLFSHDAGHYFRPAESNRCVMHAIDGMFVQLTAFLTHTGQSGGYARCYRKHRIFETLFYDPSGRKTAFFTRVESLLHLPKGLVSGYLYHPYAEDTGALLNNSHNPWRSPREPARERTESYGELVEAAIREATLQVPLAFRFLSGEADAPQALASLLAMNHGRTMEYGYKDE